MPKNRPIVLVDDDEGDLDILHSIFEHLEVSHEVLRFTESTKARDFLLQPDVRPFLIISDINMPVLNGLELRNLVVTEYGVQKATIPFLLISTGVSDKMLNSLNTSCQGYFVKPVNYQDYTQLIKKILNYWQDSVVPAHLVAER